MEDQTLHQLLHGYKHGHELLAGSTKLSPQDAEVVARLSDLSGTLQSDTHFYPYLTVYPLPSERYYAVARTWLDRDAPRTGCVLTHTILIPLTRWSSGAISAPDVISSLAQPSRESFDSYSKPLGILRHSSVSSSVSLSAEEIEPFAGKYFGEGMRPVVWFTESDPEPLLLSLLTGLWANLRKRFSACTLSLQPRTLPTGPFDLLFAPTISYSRYAKVPRENFIEHNGGEKIAFRVEPWIRRLSLAISESAPLPIPPDWPDVEAALGPEPTAVRWLYLLNDLRARTPESPTAALGAMDVVETLCPEGTTKPELKSSIAQTAICAAKDVLDSEQSLNLLQLICERLAHPSYSKIDTHVLDLISDRVEDQGKLNIEQSLAAYENFLRKSRDESKVLRAYRQGITRALLGLARTEPVKLKALHEREAAASDIVVNTPNLAGVYVGHSGADSSQAARDVSRWLRSSPREPSWLAFSTALLPLAQRIHEDQIFGDIYINLPDRDVLPALEEISLQQLNDTAIADVLVNHIASRHPAIVRNWLASLSVFPDTAARIGSATYEPSSEGLSALLQEGSFSSEARTKMVVAFLQRIFDSPTPEWLRALMATRPELIESIWHSSLDTNGAAYHVLKHLVAEVALIAPEAVPNGVAALRSLSDSPIFGDLCDLIMRSALVGILRGRLDVDFYGRLCSEPAIANWIYNVDGARLGYVISREINHNSEAWQRTWSWLAAAPQALYRTRNTVTLALVNELCRQRRANWTHSIAGSWQKILTNAETFCDFVFYLRHCVQALEFSFRNDQFPLGSVVSVAFPAVYNVVIEQSPMAWEANSLFSYDWDKGKALRRNLIEAFYQSNWAPGDLALAARRSFGLRKLFTRMRRKWNGQAYIENMLRDLHTREGDENVMCYRELISIAQHPNFYEPWD